MRKCKNFIFAIIFFALTIVSNLKVPLRLNIIICKIHNNLPTKSFIYIKHLKKIL